jgi:hypothetical protein
MSKVTIVSGCERREVNMLHKNYEPMSKRLVYSIRTNGGKYKDVNIVMWHAEGCAPSTETKAWLRDTGCEVVAGEPLGGNCEPVGNKIAAACTPVSTEYSLWIDSDMYVLNTSLFEQLLDKTVDVAAVGPEREFQRWASSKDAATWEKFYKLVGVAPPTGKFTEGWGEEDNIYRTHLRDGTPCNVYFNSAVVFFKNGRGFPQAWREIARAIRASGIENCQHNFTQTALTIAAVKTADTYEQLPSIYNAYWSFYFEKAFDAAILHYQNEEAAIRARMGDDPRVKWDL